MRTKILYTIMLLCSLSSQAAIEQWRGKLVISPQVTLVVGLNIDTDKKTLSLDSPNQQMFSYIPSEFAVSDQTITFSDKKLNASYEGAFTNGKLVGTFTQGKSMPLTFALLDGEGKQRLVLEGTYSGALDVSGNKLPLDLQVAVLQDGFHATLDSPAQQSFGIPLSQFAIDHEKVSFESALIHASFEGVMKEGVYEGTFTQGFAMPLTLKKNNK